ncbi:hypothetical protein NO932_11490 [Pelagibacterium sp. 26DY04]|uniref:hypothetical protein n=1 Tax=Pelagibacterium sp. 26DY04 TaxID=2967130 RepID=UPI002814DC5D|nr:hypothetical protein [Pelagibacterium sp. 26DY04]WMT85550.1 hypothetical protein NO932_11490 [Pelagibacterium sp. 26DY04]
MNVSKPAFRWELNINTMIVLVGFIFTWGVTYATITIGLANSAGDISGLERRVSELESSTRALDNHELRLTAVEAQARDTSSAMRSVEQSLNSLAADLRVTREILERLERSQASVVAGR